jgi:hypothetical protein
MIKSQQEVEAQIDVITRLDNVMPHYSMFGGNNHQQHLDMIEALLEAVDGDFGGSEDVQDLIDARYDELDGMIETGEIATTTEDGRLRALQWLIDDEADPLASESDVKLFSDKAAGK